MDSEISCPLKRPEFAWKDMNERRDEIFCDLMELPPGDRDMALRAMADVPDVDKILIRRMLDEADEADSYFTGTSVAVKMLPETFDLEAAGEMCGPYRLVSKLGEGGFGLVWLAEQEKPLKRTVAVKVIKAGMDSKEVLARFDAEKQALARMDHPNIAKVLDAGMTDLGRPYFVMELVIGKSITQYSKENGLDLNERLRLFTDVCSALNHAHQKGVIHRDIKPSNVIVTEVDSCPVAKVIDFGIAKAIDGTLTEQTLGTRIEQWIGTPAYMSPEQAGVGQKDIDTRSDIYSLGVLLYELITGEAPFDSATLLKAGYEEMRRIIREVEPPKPSVRISSVQKGGFPTNTDWKAPSNSMLKSISSELDWVVMMAIEKDRDRRYESAAELAADVVRYLANKPVEARPPSTWYLTSKFVRRNRRAMFISSLLFLILVSAASISFWQASQAREARDLAKARLVVAERERNAKDGALQDAEAVSRLFSDVMKRPSPEIDGRTVTVVQALESAFQKLNGTYVGDPKRHAMLLQVLAETYENLGLMEKSIEVRRKAMDVLRSLGETSMQATLDSAEALVSRLGHVGRYSEAAELAAEVFRQHEVNHGPNHPATIRMLETLALNTFRSGKYAKAIDYQERLVSRMTETMPGDHPNVTKSKEDLLAFCHDSGDLERGANLAYKFRSVPAPISSSDSEIDSAELEDDLKEKWEILKRQENDLGKTNTTTIATRMEVASILAGLGNQREAVDAQNEVVNLCKTVYGETHPKTLEAVEKCIEIHERFLDWKSAYPVQQEAARIRMAAHGLDHYESLCYYGNRIFALSLIKRADEGLQLGQEYLPKISQVMGPNSRAYYQYSSNYARCLAVAGRSKDAIAVLAKSSPHMPDDTFVNLLYATILIWNGRNEEYEQLRTRMLDYWQSGRERAIHHTFQLERNAIICTLLPFRNESQRKEIAATLDKVENILKSPQYEKHLFHGPSWSKTMQGVVHYRLGNHDLAIERFKEAEQIAGTSGSDTLDLERKLLSIYYPLAMYKMGRVREAKQMFKKGVVDFQRWKDENEPLLGANGTDGVEIFVFLSYKEALGILGEMPE